MLQEEMKANKHFILFFLAFFHVLSLMFLFHFVFWFFFNISCNSNTNVNNAVLMITPGCNFCTLPGNLVAYITPHYGLKTLTLMDIKVKKIFSILLSSHSFTKWRVGKELAKKFTTFHLTLKPTIFLPAAVTPIIIGMIPFWC